MSKQGAPDPPRRGRRFEPTLQRRADPPDGQRPLVYDRVQRVRLAPLRVGRCSCRGLHAALIPSNYWLAKNCTFPLVHPGKRIFGPFLALFSGAFHARPGRF